MIPAAESQNKWFPQLHFHTRPPTSQQHHQINNCLCWTYIYIVHTDGCITYGSHSNLSSTQSYKKKTPIVERELDGVLLCILYINNGIFFFQNLKKAFLFFNITKSSSRSSSSSKCEKNYYDTEKQGVLYNTRGIWYCCCWPWIFSIQH